MTREWVNTLWTIPVFSYLLDTARVNSRSLWSLTNDKQPSEGNSFDFIFELSECLFRPLIERRNTTHLSHSTSKKINSILNNNSYTSSFAPSDAHALTNAPAPPYACAPSDVPAPTNAPAPSDAPVPPAAPVPSDAPALTNAPASPDTSASLDVPAHRATVTLTRKRCRMCITDVNQLDITERKNKVMKLSPVITKCALCSGSVCKNHYILVCTECKNNMR